MEINGVAVNSTVQTPEVSWAVCSKHGHNIVFFENGKFICTKCGMSLDEIRGKKETHRITDPKAA